MITCDRSAKRHYGDDTESFRRWSVSQVCAVLAGERTYAPGADERGQDVHDIFALAVGHYAGLCVEPEVPEQYAGYYCGMQVWIATNKPHPAQFGIERMMKHATLPYAGRMDFVGSIGPDFGVLDLKTGAKEKWHLVQVHGYQKLLDKAAKMWLLYINAEGAINFKKVAFDPRHWSGFQNGLSVLQWREL